MIQETIKAVKEAEAKAQPKIKDASVRAGGIISEAEKEGRILSERRKQPPANERHLI